MIPAGQAGMLPSDTHSTSSWMKQIRRCFWQTKNDGMGSGAAGCCCCTLLRCAEQARGVAKNVLRKLPALAR